MEVVLAPDPFGALPLYGPEAVAGKPELPHRVPEAVTLHSERQVINTCLLPHSGVVRAQVPFVSGPLARRPPTDAP